MTRFWSLLAGVLVLTSLLVGQGGAASAGARLCSPFRPVEPGEDSYSQQKERALKAPVRKITPSATADDPVVIEYEQGPSIYAVYDPVVEDTQFFNIQILSKKRTARLNIRQEWAWPSPNDFDLLLFNAVGARVAESQALLPVGDPYYPDSGPGYEVIKDHHVERCSGYTIESKGFFSPGTSLRLVIWLS